MTRTTNNQIINGRLFNGYDYVNQAWVINGEYADCGHPQAGEELAPFMGLPAGRIFPGCSCYGRTHFGETCTTDGTTRPNQTNTNGHHSDCDDKSVDHATFMCSLLCPLQESKEIA